MLFVPYASNLNEIYPTNRNNFFALFVLVQLMQFSWNFLFLFSDLGNRFCVVSCNFFLQHCFSVQKILSIFLLIFFMYICLISNFFLVASFLHCPAFIKWRGYNRKIFCCHLKGLKKFFLLNLLHNLAFLLGFVKCFITKLVVSYFMFLCLFINFLMLHFVKCSLAEVV